MKKIFRGVIRSKGVTMLEMLLVLAVIAVLLVLATRYYASTSYSQKLSQLQASVNSIKAAVANYKLGHPTLDGLETYDDGIQSLYNAGFLPKADLNAATTAVLTPWGEDIKVARGSGSPLTARIIFSGLTRDSKNACTNLADTITTNIADTTEYNTATCAEGDFEYRFVP